MFFRYTANSGMDNLRPFVFH